MSVREVLTFPNPPVNDYAARTTAGLVVVLAIVAVAVNEPIVYGLLASASRCAWRRVRRSPLSVSSR